MTFSYAVLVAAGLPVDPWLLWVFAFLSAAAAAESLIQLARVSAAERDAGSSLYTERKRRRRGSATSYTLGASALP